MKIEPRKPTLAPAAPKPEAATSAKPASSAADAAKPAASAAAKPASAETANPAGILSAKTDFAQAKALQPTSANPATKLTQPTKSGFSDFQTNTLSTTTRLGTGAVAGAQAAQQTVNQQKVDQATTQVQQILDRRGAEFPAVRDAMKDLNPAEFNAVLRNMSDDQMRAITTQCKDAYISGPSMQEAYNFMAGKADAANLSRMLPHVQGPEHAQMLGQAVAQNASAPVKEQFVSQNKGLLNHDEHGLNATMAIGEALGGLKNNPANLERALNDLGAEGRQALISNSINYAGGACRESALGPLSKTIDAVAGLPGNAQMKAEMFMSASTALTSVEGRNGVTGSELRGNLAKVLQSDVNGVVGALENMDRNGTSLIPQLKSMMQSGQTQPISEIMAKLSRGNDLQGDPMARFGQTVQAGGGEHHDNAENIGFFYGALYQATKGAVNDVNQQADLLKRVVDGAGTVAGMALPGAGTAIGVAGTFANKTVDWWADQMRQGYEGFRDAMQQASFPKDASGRNYEGPAEGAYDSAISRFHD